MKNIKLILMVSFLIFALSGILHSGDDKDTNFYGGFLLGYRIVDLSDHSTLTKFKEDVNLENGPRLFNFNFHYMPDRSMKKVFDRLDISLNNLGGDPFESMSLSFVKYGRYSFKYKKRKSSYFYKDILAGDDFHNFNFDRVMDNGSLKVWIGKKAHLFMDFNLYSKKGMNTTTLDISHEEYELEKPVDESSKDFSLGFDIRLGKYSFLFIEKIQDYKNDYNIFLPGFSLGENKDFGNVEELDYFFLNQPYDYRNFSHTLKINGRPSDNLLIRGSFQLSTQDLRLSYSEEASGVAYTGADLLYAYNGDGNIDRTMGLYDLDISYLMSDKVAVNAAVRYHNFDQDGIMTIDNNESDAALAYNNFGIEAGIQFQPSKKLAFSVGFRSETRNVEHDGGHDGGDNEKTTRTGLFGNMKFNLSKRFKLTADYQYGTYKDPFTLVSPKDFHRFRLTGKYHKKNFFITGYVRYNKVENNIDYDWFSDRFQINLRTGFHNDKVYISLGYGIIDVLQQGNRLLSNYGPPANWDILYEGTTNLVDAYLHYNFSKKFTGGVFVNYYSNTGSWELKRVNSKIYLKMNWENNFITQLAYRYIDFQETVMGFNDYKANIFEFAFGYSWK